LKTGFTGGWLRCNSVNSLKGCLRKEFQGRKQEALFEAPAAADAESFACAASSFDNARRRGAIRHGGQQRLDIHNVEITAKTKDAELLAVNDALESLAALDPEKA
jgi:ECF sigma factor